MKIVSENVFEGPSIFAPVPAVRLVVDLEDLMDRSPAGLGEGFAANLVAFLPELETAARETGETEAFASALRRDQSLCLSHVVSRVALELQRVAGVDVSYHAATALEPSGHHEVVYGHWDAVVGVRAGRLATRVVAHLAQAFLTPEDGRPPTWEPVATRQKFLAIARERSLDISTAAMVREAMRRGIPWRRLNPRMRFVQFGHGRFQRRIYETMPFGTPIGGGWIAADKGVSNRLFYELGLPVPAQAVVKDADRAAAAADELGYPAVVKPVDGKKGLGVGVELGDTKAVRKAFREASKFGKTIVVEQFIAGDDHRILVVGGKVIAAARRIPGHVVGDGARSIAELVDVVNQDPRRGTGFDNVMVRLEFDDQAERMLSERRLTRDSVPAKGEVVPLRRTANISTGGTAVDVTDIIHPDICRAAVRAATALGLDAAGVDFLSTDIGRSYKEIGGAICEINVSPGLRPHWLADDTRDVVGPIMNVLYPPGAQHRVPIAAITGTNGKTTTTRMVARILERAGHVVGYATTDGAYVDGELLVKEDVAGLSGARLVLQSPDVDAAVLETARRGIIRRGLAFDWCDVGAVLNIEDDHIGTDGIRDMDDLARVKSLVARVTRGTLVLNADDERCVAMATDAPADRLCYVTMVPDEPLATKHIAAGAMAVTLRLAEGGPVIVLHEDGAATDVLSVRAVPATLDGKAMHNVQNTMFAVAIARALGTSLDSIRGALESFACNWDETPGRLNIFGELPFTVVVDYAHNPKEVEVITAVVRQLDCTGRRIVAFTSNGDRTDRQLRKLAAVAAAGAYDHYVCFRRDDLRGRGPSEVPDFLRDGLVDEGIPAEKISVVPVETEAIDAALDMARRGDMVVILNTDHYRTWPMVTARHPRRVKD